MPPTEAPFNYEGVKDRTLKWCQKLYQDGIYDYKQYQACLSTLEAGNINYYKAEEEEESDDNYEKRYGYKQTPEEQTYNVNPAKPVVKDDFVIVYLYHFIEKGYLLSNSNNIVSIDNDPVDRDQREWQLISITIPNESETFVIKSRYGNYLTGTNQNTVNANSKVLTPWTQWKLKKYNDNFAFYSIAHKKYLSVHGDDIILSDGWSDKNLWILKNKTNPMKGYINRFDPSKLTNEKDRICNLMYDSYENALTYTYKVNYYENKVLQLEYLRNLQLNHLVDIANNLIRQATDKKAIIGKSITNLNKEIESLATVDRLDMVKANQEFESECNMTSNCLQSAISLNNGAYGFFGNWILNRRKNECGWSNEKANKIRTRTYQQPTEEYCLQLKAKADDLTQLVAKNKDEYLNMLKRNVEIVEDLNYRIAELEVFKSEITNEFTLLIVREKQELINLGAESLNLKKSSYATYVQIVNDIQKFIDQLTYENSNLEIQTNNLADDIDENLESYDKLTSTYYDRNPVKTKKDLDTIISSNQNVITTKVKNIKNMFYIGVLETLFLIMFTIFMFMKAFGKFLT